MSMEFIYLNPHLLEEQQKQSQQSQQSQSRNFYQELMLLCLNILALLETRYLLLMLLYQVSSVYKLLLLLIPCNENIWPKDIKMPLSLLAWQFGLRTINPSFPSTP